MRRLLQGSALFILSCGWMAAQTTNTQPAPTPAPAGQTPSQPGYQDPLQKPAAQPTPTQTNQAPSMPPYNTPLQQPIPSQPVPQNGKPGPSKPTPTQTSQVPSVNPYSMLEPVILNDYQGSTYIPEDSWVYPAVMRLYSMGFVNQSFMTMRTWTRRSLLHVLQDSEGDIAASDNTQAQEILSSLKAYLSAELPPDGVRGTIYGLDSVYGRIVGISGPVLRDSFHLGQTLVNDYARPYQTGANAILGFSTVNESGRFSLYVRGEYQHAPSATGYSNGLAAQLSEIDAIIPYTAPNRPQDTVPEGPIATVDTFRLQEAVVSYHLLGHEVSFGKSDSWTGPGYGGGMAWSNNAENMYTFRINRVEPLHVPFLSRYLGPMRYDFFVGSLKGHTFPNAPWAHGEMFAFRPTSNFEFQFERTVIWGGKDHTPITLHTFLKSFFDISDATGQEKAGRNDPGARYSAFSFSYRLPLLRRHVTLYTDSIVHDDVTPPSAPRRAAYRPGVYISQIPGLPRLDFRVEAASTDTSTLRSVKGEFNYYETVQRQGYTNKGFIMGDWIGREAKGGQAWMTWHLSGNEWIQLSYLNKKTPKDFIPGGTTQNQFKVDVVKRIGKDIEVEGWVQYERWKAPIYMSGQQNNTAVAGRVTWYPKLRTTALNGK